MSGDLHAGQAAVELMNESRTILFSSGFQKESACYPRFDRLGGNRGESDS